MVVGEEVTGLAAGTPCPSSRRGPLQAAQQKTCWTGGLPGVTAPSPGLWEPRAAPGPWLPVSASFPAPGLWRGVVDLGELL